jgi:hypothetical protein
MLFGGGALDQTYISESTVGFPMMPHIHPWSLEAVTALTILSSGGGALSAAVSTVWPIANISIFYPFALCERTRLRSLWCRNGATVSGNIDMGIYTGELNRKIVSSGSVAQAGINSYQTAAIDVTLGPGVYQFAIACSNTTATFFGTTVTGAEFSASDGSISSMTANFPLGAALSMSSPQIFIPLAGVSRYTIV